MAPVLLEVESQLPPAAPLPRAGRRRRRLTAVTAAGLALVAATGWGLAQRTSGSGSSVAPVVPGVVTGQVPLCYGPGPDMNLTPTLLVVATEQGSVKAALTVTATLESHEYRLTLSPGTYAVRAGSWPARQVTVSAGVTTVVDLPGGGCL